MIELYYEHILMSVMYFCVYLSHLYVFLGTLKTKNIFFKEVKMKTNQIFSCFLCINDKVLLVQSCGL